MSASARRTYSWFYPRRAARRDRDHRDPGGAIAAGDPSSTRTGTAHAIHQQPPRDRPGDDSISRHLRRVSPRMGPSLSRWDAIYRSPGENRSERTRFFPLSPALSRRGGASQNVPLGQALPRPGEPASRDDAVEDPA